MKKIKNGTFSYFLFILNPLLGLFYAIKEVVVNKRINILILALFFGIMSYGYIPKISNDKTYYYYLYEHFSTLSFQQFSLFLLDKPDFIFYSLIFLFTKLNISIQILFLFVTTFTVGIWFLFFKKVSDASPRLNRNYIIFFLLALFSFQLGHLFSGIRNYFALSFVLLGYLYGIIKKRGLKGSVFLIIAGFTHFSTLIFIPFYFLLILFKENHRLFRNIFLFSFIFVFIPKTILLDLLSYFSLSDVIEAKKEGYLTGDDFIENSLAIGSFNNFLTIFFAMAWQYFAWIYLLFTLKRKSLLRNITYIFIAISNFFYTIPGTSVRYLLIAQILFVCLLVYDYFRYQKNLTFSKIVLVLFIISTIGKIYGDRDIYIKSYVNIYSTSLVTYFLNDEIKPMN